MLSIYLKYVWQKNFNESCQVFKISDINYLNTSYLPWYANASIDVKPTTNSLNGHEFVETIHRVYDEIVQWRKTFWSFFLGRQPKYL